MWGMKVHMCPANTATGALAEITEPVRSADSSEQNPSQPGSKIPVGGQVPTRVWSPPWSWQKLMALGESGISEKICTTSPRLTVMVVVPPGVSAPGFPPAVRVLEVNVTDVPSVAPTIVTKPG